MHTTSNNSSTSTSSHSPLPRSQPLSNITYLLPNILEGPPNDDALQSNASGPAAIGLGICIARPSTPTAASEVSNEPKSSPLALQTPVKKASPKSKENQINKSSSKKTPKSRRRSRSSNSFQRYLTSTGSSSLYPTDIEGNFVIQPPPYAFDPPGSIEATTYLSTDDIKLEDLFPVYESPLQQPLSPFSSPITTSVLPPSDDTAFSLPDFCFDALGFISETPDDDIFRDDGIFRHRVLEAQQLSIDPSYVFDSYISSTIDTEEAIGSRSSTPTRLAPDIHDDISTPVLGGLNHGLGILNMPPLTLPSPELMAVVKIEEEAEDLPLVPEPSIPEPSIPEDQSSLLPTENPVAQDTVTEIPSFTAQILLILAQHESAMAVDQPQRDIKLEDQDLQLFDPAVHGELFGPEPPKSTSSCPPALQQNATHIPQRPLDEQPPPPAQPGAPAIKTSQDELALPIPKFSWLPPYEWRVMPAIYAALSPEELAALSAPVIAAFQGISLVELETRAAIERYRTGNEVERNWLASFAGRLSPQGQEISGYRCYIIGCSQTNKRRDHIITHVGCHLGLRPFKCSHCPQSFSRKNELVRHELGHTGTKRFQCDICTKFMAFARRDLLQRHLKNTHGIYRSSIGLQPTKIEAEGEGDDAMKSSASVHDAPPQHANVLQPIQNVQEQAGSEGRAKKMRLDHILN